MVKMIDLVKEKDYDFMQEDFQKHIKEDLGNYDMITTAFALIAVTKAVLNNIEEIFGIRTDMREHFIDIIEMDASEMEKVEDD